jgi:hypothetical protein
VKAVAFFLISFIRNSQFIPKGKACHDIPNIGYIRSFPLFSRTVVSLGSCFRGYLRREEMRAAQELTNLDRLVADAILGIDTLWGGDVLHPSGTGRFIADSWFSQAPLPAAYTHSAAAQLRRTGGVSAKKPDRSAVKLYLASIDVLGAIRGIADKAESLPPLRRTYLKGLATCFEVMWDLAMEMLGKGDMVPYERCVRASTGQDPQPSDPAAKRKRVRELLDRAGYPSSGRDELSAAVDAWRKDRRISCNSIPALSSAFIAEFDRLAAKNILPYLPKALHSVSRANIRFLPITGAWFSGSMNYLGRARKEDDTPEYEATYEINSSLEISVPEFQQLVSHEVVPGHVTTFAFLQNLYERKKVGFEATVQTMNTLGASLSEGLANNALLMAYDVTEIDRLPDEDLQIGLLLALLQDDAKNQSSYLLWKEKAAQPEVAAILLRDYLVSRERADKLSGAWGRHPLMGRMYLPVYRAGTEKVAELRRKYPPDRVLPALYGCRGLVDLMTVESAI